MKRNGDIHILINILLIWVAIITMAHQVQKLQDAKEHPTTQGN